GSQYRGRLSGWVFGGSTNNAVLGGRSGEAGTTNVCRSCADAAEEHGLCSKRGNEFREAERTNIRIKRQLDRGERTTGDWQHAVAVARGKRADETRSEFPSCVVGPTRRAAAAERRAATSGEAAAKRAAHANFEVGGVCDVNFDSNAASERRQHAAAGRVFLSTIQRKNTTLRGDHQSRRVTRQRSWHATRPLPKNPFRCDWFALVCLHRGKGGSG